MKEVLLATGVSAVVAACAVCCHRNPDISTSKADGITITEADAQSAKEKHSDPRQGANRSSSDRAEGDSAETVAQQVPSEIRLIPLEIQMETLRDLLEPSRKALPPGDWDPEVAWPRPVDRSKPDSMLMRELEIGR